MARPRILTDEERSQRRKQYTKLHYEKNKSAKRAYYESNKSVILEQKVIHRSTPEYRYSKYKSNAKKKGIEFSLTKDEFNSLWNASCVYCGSSIDTIGLDRKDNTVGYHMDNIVACCSKCNYMKRDTELDEFTAHLRSILHHLHNPITITHDTKHRRNRIYSAYKYDAAKRGIQFEISVDEYDVVVHTNCQYCGTVNDIGIDRVDNSIGYITSNVVSCCTTCNYMKHTQDKYEFISHVIRINSHLEKTYVDF